MEYQIDLSRYREGTRFDLGKDFRGSSPAGEWISFNNYYMEKNGKPFFSVAGELHYSRMEASRWEDELIKMRMGGINVVSTYLFWNHIEEEEGVFDFTGRRDLRRFVSLCGKHGMYVILRVGPFDHGEVRNGGLPDWLYGKPFEVRHTNEEFLRYVRRLYGKIGEQTRGLFYQDGGPVIAVQLDNEYMHSSAMWEITTGISNEWINKGDEGEKYILALREIALECGLKPAFFTGTAWGGAAYSPRVLPLWGGYAYRPWIFYSHRGEHPATEEYIYEDYHHNGAVCADDFTPEYPPEDRPYACCEMGAGMMCCYYYRFIYPYRSVDALANIKTGSGCNFLGYYMFHGGTNPIGKNGTYLNEAQVPKISYDYQAALGEFGQIRESYSRLKSIHFFTRFFGDRLAPMETVLPEGASATDPRDTETLRFAVRTSGESGFLFINNFQDHLDMPARKHDRVRVITGAEEYDFDISLAPEENAILPFGMDLDGILLRQAAAQPVLRTEADGRVLYVFMENEGLPADFRFGDGAEVTGNAGPLNGEAARCFTVRQGERQTDVLLISREMANRLFLLRDGSLIFTGAALLEDELGHLRLETVEPDNILQCWPPERLGASGKWMRMPDRGPLGEWRMDTAKMELKVSVMQTARHKYVFSLPELPEKLKDVRLRISYEGDIGMLFLDNTMISDNFCNGDTWEIGLREHREALKTGRLALTIAPVREGAVVSTESAMAARSEESRQETGKLISAALQPVYEIVI
ncbi:MAG: beta-galactosidase [Clostridia bacterium]|nr:beta-galactosidase [Clostridia bacterium]